MEKKKHNRKLSNYLLDKKLQLRYVLFVTALSAVICGTLGYLIWQQADVATSIIRDQLAADPLMANVDIGSLENNDENLIFLDDFRLANLYFQEFARRYRAAGGTADLTVDAPEVAPDLLSRVRAFPNPAAMELLLQIDAPEDGVVRIGLHDVAGRILESREVPASAGTSREMSWDLSDRAAGIYFIRVSGAGIDERRRVALLR